MKALPKGSIIRHAVCRSGNPSWWFKISRQIHNWQSFLWKTTNNSEKQKRYLCLCHTFSKEKLVINNKKYYLRLSNYLDYEIILSFSHIYHKLYKIFKLYIIPRNLNLSNILILFTCWSRFYNWVSVLYVHIQDIS